MVEHLRSAGISVDFEPVAMEVAGRDTYHVDLNGKTYDVRIEGRCDIVLRYVGEAIPGVISPGDVVFADLKSKDKLSGVGGVERRGVPPYTVGQMAAYSLITFHSKDARWSVENDAVYREVNLAILHYESLQKPKEDVTETKDVYSVVVRADHEDKRRLLVRFATVVEAIEKGEVPAPDTSKCAFCAYKRQCALDGGSV